MGKYVVYLSKSDASDIENRGVGGYIMKQLSSLGLHSDRVNLHVLDNLWWISHMKFDGCTLMSTVFQGADFANDVDVVIK